MAYLIYDINSAGRITLPPLMIGQSTPDTPPRSGYDRRECTSISEVERVERILQQQSRDEQESQAEQESRTFDLLKDQVRRNIRSAIESACTDEYAKDFLRAWCDLRDEKRRSHYASIFRQRECYIEALHNDSPRTPEEMLGESL